MEKKKVLNIPIPYSNLTNQKILQYPVDQYLSNANNQRF